MFLVSGFVSKMLPFPVASLVVKAYDDVCQLALLALPVRLVKRLSMISTSFIRRRVVYFLELSISHVI